MIKPIIRRHTIIYIYKNVIKLYIYIYISAEKCYNNVITLVRVMLG